MNQNYQFLRIADRKSSNENMNEKDCQIKSQALQGRQSSNADQINPNQDNSENNEFRIFNTIDCRQNEKESLKLDQQLTLDSCAKFETQTLEKVTLASSNKNNNRADRKKRKYQSKLSALIIGLNNIGKDISEKFNTTSSRQPPLKSQSEVSKKNCSIYQKDFKVNKSKLNKKNAENSSELDSIKSNHFNSVECLPTKENEKNRILIAPESIKSKYRNKMSLIKSDYNLSKDSVIKYLCNKHSKERYKVSLKKSMNFVPKSKYLNNFMNNELKQNSPLSHLLSEKYK